MKTAIYVTTLIATSAFAIAPTFGAQYAHPVGHIAQATTPEQRAPAGRAVVDDRELMLRVHSALGKDKDIAPLSLSIKVNDGNVALSGVVPNQSQIDRAIEIVRAVPGVKSVTSEVRVS